MINLKKIPPVDEILQYRELESFFKVYNRDFVVGVVRQALERIRQYLKNVNEEWSREELVERIIEEIRQVSEEEASGTLRKVINGTGVVLHTNMGRAPLGRRALHNMQEMAVNYNNLEFDLEKGERGSRYFHVEELLRKLTGAEAALVVNNNAAAVLLGLNTLAKGREVIVSRGQLVEIGGAFRIPEVMKLSGAKLVEVGTTNKTYIRDFAEAINENTALLFAAHTSNYKIIGFSQEVELSELVKLGREKGLPVMQDLGSGVLCDLSPWGLKDEPTVQQCIKAGADIVTFSGDKLLGGPQAGIIVGKKEYVEAMKKNQLTRALRVDKLTISALEGTLLEYWCGNPYRDIPVINMLTLSREELRERAEKLKELLVSRFEGDKQVKKIEMVQLEDMVGGGAYPATLLPGYGVEIELADLKIDKISSALRRGRPALVTRVKEDRLLISVRTLLEEDYPLVAELLYKAVYHA
ncbi:L-seryl-tRNA(Sec) selenium transferase [Thermosyntropha lipolytica DSM 11003]|uniref:L-seryl-tRNA(Sec) selenium transferase n=1 Tax=Thermosyntropha lipolytica DSM 11003 TaxID=1123382 RepID=A0A1M5QX28_9FIRM|nr:L-seryl-tRNA(Sec) selenium transferase [Thermosyntropha lipolytica]SHH18113.1 L-seryl-tRNA(Sec) selenium transferase [Thermosyntropha lipolytica DSM 11003]